MSNWLEEATSIIKSKAGDYKIMNTNWRDCIKLAGRIRQLRKGKIGDCKGLQTKLDFMSNLLEEFTSLERLSQKMAI